MYDNKRGWMRIMEATIAVLIVCGVMIVVYSKQVDRGIEPAQYFYELEREILSDIAFRNDLRLNVLNSNETDLSDDNFTILKDFVGGKIPDFVDYTVSVCAVGSTEDYCKMNSTYVAMTREKDVYVEDIIISADLGDGNSVSTAIYSPKKVRLFMWEKYK